MISLVTTVYNDREGVKAFFESMSAQSLLPDEIVMTDAGSSDGTWELILKKSAQIDQFLGYVNLRVKDYKNLIRGGV